MLRRTVVIICLFMALMSGRLFAGTNGLQAYEVRWSPDGRWLGVGSSDGIWIFDAQNTETAPLHYEAGKNVYVTAFDPVRPYVAFAPDGGEKVYVLDIETGDEIYHAVTPKEDSDGYSAVFYDLAYSDNGQYLSVLNASMIYTLDAATGEEVFAKRSSLMSALDYANNDTTVMASDWDGFVLIYRVKDGYGPIVHMPNIESESGTRYSIHRFEMIPKSQRVVLLAGSKLLIYSMDRNLISDITPPKTIKDWRSEDIQDYVSGFDMSTDATQIAIGMTNTWFLYDLKQKAVTQTFVSPSLWPENGARVYSLAFNPAGDQVATLQNDGQFKVWDVTTGEMTASWDLFKGGVSQKWG